MEQRELRSTELRYCTEVVTSLADVEVGRVARGAPVREFSWHPKQGNYPGWLWTATTGTLVGYESLLERDRVLLADFDPAGAGIASQPFWLSGLDDGVRHRHVPDYLLTGRDGSVVVVDVKPARMCEEPEVAVVLEWTGRLCRSRGWRYEVFHGEDPVVMANLRFLAQGRRAMFLDEECVSAVVAAGRSGMTLGQVEAHVSGFDALDVRASALALLWRQAWTTDLSRGSLISMPAKEEPCPAGILTLHAGSRVWFEGVVWEVDTFIGDQARLRRGVTVRSVSGSASALLAAATPFDDTTEDRDQEVDPFTLPAVALAGLTSKQRREVERKVEELRPLLEPWPSGPVGPMSAFGRR